MNMAMPNFYPKLDENALKQAKKLAASIPGYLEDSNCPYGPEVKDILLPKPILPAAPAPRDEVEVEIEEVDFDSMDSSMLMDEINELYAQLKASGANIGSASDKSEGSERNVYFRLMTSLLEKVVDMKTRLMDHAHIAAFKDTVMGAMEDILDPDQRNQFIERIKKLEE